MRTKEEILTLTSSSERRLVEVLVDIRDVAIVAALAWMPRHALEENPMAARRVVEMARAAGVAPAEPTNATADLVDAERPRQDALDAEQRAVVEDLGGGG